MNVLCIGESLLETTCPINGSIGEGMKLRLFERAVNGGGHAGNVAYFLGKWGVDTYIASIMGADDAATRIKKEYENIGVKTDYIETTYDKNTGSVLNLVNSVNKTNTIIELASNSLLKKYSFVIEPTIIVTDGTDLGAAHSAFDKYPGAKKFLLAVRNTKDVTELCRFVNCIIFNSTTAEEIVGAKFDYNNSATLVNIYNRLKQKFSNAEIVITLNEKGSIYSINGQIKVMPPAKIEVVDAYGAGDAFAGAFIYSMAREFGTEKSICYATISASMSVGKMTSRMSFPALTEVSNYYDSKFGAQNNPNNTQSPEQVSTNQNQQAPTPSQAPQAQAPAAAPNTAAQTNVEGQQTPPNDNVQNS